MNSIFTFIFTKTPLVFFAQSIWRDEAFSCLLAQKNIGEIFLLTAKDSNPPLYYFLLHYWIRMFGHFEIALRSLSLVFFCMTAYVFFLFLHKIFRYSPCRSFLYLLLFIANPVLHYYAFETRMYTMFAFFSLTSYYFFVQKNYKWYGVQVILGMLTHYFMVFVVMSQILYLFMDRKKTQEIKKHIHSLTVSFFFFLPWIIFVLISKPTIDNTFWISKPVPLTFIQLPAIILTGFEWDFWYKNSLLIPVSIVLTIIIAIISSSLLRPGRIMHNNKHKSIMLLLSIWSLFIPFFILCISFVKPLFIPRYLIFSTIGLLLLFSYLFPKTKKSMEIVLLTGLLIISLSYMQTQIHARKKANVREVAKIIKALITPNDVIYVTNEFNFHPLQYYINDKQVYIYGKTYEELPWYIGKVLISPDNITQSLPVYPKKAFILKDDLSFVIQANY